MTTVARWMLALSIVVLLSAPTMADKPFKLEEGFKLLFNGKDLTGWKLHGNEKWYVEDGTLICESGPQKKYSYLATDRNYDDFELRLEFWVEGKGNSGVFFRSKLDGVNIKGWQAEVADAGQPTGYVYGSGYGGWLNVPKDKKKFTIQKPAGQWNEMWVRVVGGHVLIHVNSQKTSDFTDEKIAKGKGVIALQIHSGGGVKVRWRNIRIQEITSK